MDLSQTLSMGYQAGNSASAPNVAGNRQQRDEKQACLAVTVKTIEAAVAERNDDSADLRIHGVEPGMLMFVGLIESVSRKAASIDFMFNDTTGRIQARYYITDAESALKGAEPGRYVSIAAAVRTEPALHLSVTCFKPVASADEVSCHFIECAHTALKLKASRHEKETEKRPPTTPQRLQAAAPADVLDSTIKEKSQPAKAQPNLLLTGKALQQAIVELLQGQGAGPEGISISFLSDRLGAGTPLAEVRTAIEVLIDDGELYTTIDEDHVSLI